MYYRMYMDNIIIFIYIYIYIYIQVCLYYLRIDAANIFEM